MCMFACWYVHRRACTHTHINSCTHTWHKKILHVHLIYDACIYAYVRPRTHLYTLQLFQTLTCSRKQLSQSRHRQQVGPSSCQIPLRRNFWADASRAIASLRHSYDRRCVPSASGKGVGVGVGGGGTVQAKPKCLRAIVICFISDICVCT